MDWLRLTARGRPGHGSLINEDNAVTALAEAVARVGRHRFPTEVTPTVRAMLGEVSQALGIALDPDDPEAAIGKLGPVAALLVGQHGGGPVVGEKTSAVRCPSGSVACASSL